MFFPMSADGRRVTDSTPVQCPICGWTGSASDLDTSDTEPECPVCGEAVSP
jgi:predicted RNA-binding Zn-ribbon protein involved in translation (DUF1610 family)